MEPRRFKLGVRNPLVLPGHIIRLVGIEDGNKAILSIESLGGQEPDIDMQGRKLDTKPNDQ